MDLKKMKKAELIAMVAKMEREAGERRSAVHKADEAKKEATSQASEARAELENAITRISTAKVAVASALATLYPRAIQLEHSRGRCYDGTSIGFYSQRDEKPKISKLNFILEGEDWERRRDRRATDERETDDDPFFNTLSFLFKLLWVND